MSNIFAEIIDRDNTWINLCAEQSPITFKGYQVKVRVDAFEIERKSTNHVTAGAPTPKHEAAMSL